MIIMLMASRGMMTVMHVAVSLIIGRVQVPWIVPRKTYRDFHADIFPETASAHPVMVCSN